MLPAGRTVTRTLAALGVVLALGGVPGAALRSLAVDSTTAALPDAPDRDGAADVTVRGEAGAPVFGARVRAIALVDERGYLADSRETDAAGHARFARLPRGEIWLVADAPGRARGSARVVIDVDPRAITLDLGPEHTIDVAVTDELGAAIAGAEIEAAEPGDPLPIGARAGEDGIAHVTRLGPGPWRLAARAAGYEEAAGRASRDGEVVALVLRRLSAILVHVVGPDDRATAGARVAVAGATLWPPRAGETDARGDMRIGGLSAGSYALRASKGDLVSPTELGAQVGRGQEKTVTLRLAAGAFVGVRVTDGEAEDAEPLAGAQVSLAEAGLSPFPLEATTDARGRARLGPISAGSATLDAHADGFVSRGAVSVSAPPPAETRVALLRAGTLTGRVVDSRGRPIDGATIEIAGTDASGGPIFDDPRRARFRATTFDAMLAGPAALVPAGELGVMPGPVTPIPHQGAGGGDVAPSRGAARPSPEVEPWVTRADGTFRAAPATPGRIRAIVHHPQHVEAESEVVTLAPGGEQHVDVVMHEGGSLEGRVLDAHDRPVEGARVTVSATLGTLERTTRTAGDGAFAFAALPDAVSLTASAADDAQPDVRLAVSVPEGGRKEITIHLPDPHEPLPVTVVDDRGAAVGAAQITTSSLSADSPLRATTFTDANGEATIPRARGLPLRVEVRAPHRAPRVVTTDGTRESLRVELLPGEGATGEVVAARGGDAIAGAEVTLYTDIGVRRARADAKGAFALADLAPGAARLHVRAPGFAPTTRDVAVPDSGGRRSYAISRVELAADGVVRGEVVDRHGDPVAGARVARDQVPTWLLVGSSPEGVAVTDAKGRFALRELPEGTLTLEAYAPEVGRARVLGVKVVAGRTADEVRIVIAPDAGDEPSKGEPGASGGVAITLGETAAPTEVVVVSVVEGSEAERGGLAPGDVLLAVDSAAVPTMAEARAKLSGPIADDVVVTVRRGEGTLTLRVPREQVRR